MHMHDFDEFPFDIDIVQATVFQLDFKMLKISLENGGQQLYITKCHMYDVIVCTEYGEHHQNRYHISDKCNGIYFQIDIIVWTGQI